jgi:catechol 2,3-dioxygenase-like lactoylglutathione lyase family enzyme
MTSIALPGEAIGCGRLSAGGKPMTAQGVELNRRRFLEWASASTSFFAAHNCFAAEEPLRQSTRRDSVTGPRIAGLQLLSSAPLGEMKEFYHRLLGLNVLEETSGRLTIAAGASRLDFIETKTEGDRPFYHFAFNIPENKILEAWRWQTQRTGLISIPARLRDPHYPDDVVDYRHWNAHSIFFLDPAGNVVEYIARHDLKNTAVGEFNTADILYASEIGLVVDDVPATAVKLREVVGVDQYKGGSDQFTAIGDEQGLLLIMKRGRILNFNPASDDKAARVFRTAATVRGIEGTTYRFAEFPYEISVER